MALALFHQGIEAAVTRKSSRFRVNAPQLSAAPRLETRACLQRVAAWGGRAHVGAMRRLDVTDEQWRRLEPLLPPEKPRTGRPNHDHRRVVSGMLWIHRTGAPWRDLPEPVADLARLHEISHPSPWRLIIP